MIKFLIIGLLSFTILANVKIQIPPKIIKSLFQKVKMKSFEKDMASQKIVTSYFDYNEMTKKILGSEIRKHKDAEILWFTSHIRKIVTKTVYSKAHDFLKNVKFEHEVLSKGKNKFTVLTIVKKRGEETEVESKFERNGNKWKIVDISIDDESWIENIGEQVRKTIKKKKWSGLKKSLIKRLKEL